MVNNSQENIEEILKLKYKYDDALQNEDFNRALQILQRLGELYKLETGKEIEELIGKDKLELIKSKIEKNGLDDKSGTIDSSNLEETDQNAQEERN